jgi:two-component system sensor histidine kinase ArlS
MKQKISSFVKKLSWQTKLVLSGSTAIFLTFFLFSFLEYHMVSKWMMQREESSINKTMTDITTFYKQNSYLTANDIRKSVGFLRKMNTKDQLIRVYDQNGEILAADKNGDFSVLEPTPTKKQTIEKVSIEGNEAIVGRNPLINKQFKGTVEVVRQLNNYHKMMNNLFWGMNVFGIGAILLSAISGYFLAKQLLKPVREIAETMKRIKKNGFQERMEIYPQKDELADLTNVFNEMMDELEKSFLQQKQFVEDASHELRTPVSILEGHLSLLNRWGKKDPAILDESLNASLQELTRLKKLITDLLSLTRAENHLILREDKADLQAIIHHLIKNLAIVHPDFQFHLEVEEQLPFIAISEQHLEQILIILLDNSIKYSPVHKIINVSAKLQDENVLLSVVDKGIGIPHEHIQEVFNRFYRIDKARARESGGTGLGLSIAKRLIEIYNGSISLESKEKEGTTVNVLLPVTFRKFP